MARATRPSRVELEIQDAKMTLLLRAAPYVLFHLACLGVLAFEFSWQLVALFLASYYLRMIGVTLGYHRYFAHRSFKTSRGFQFILALLGAASLQRGTFWWAWTHRYHHQHTDTPEDIHAPKYKGIPFAYWGWVFDERYIRVPEDAVQDLKAFPELRVLENRLVWSGVSLLYATAIFAQFGWDGLVWGYFLSTVAIWHSVHWVQVVSHSWGGYRQFDSDDDSRNHWLFGVLTLGEFHNNHHAFAWSARQGFLWWEIDLGFWMLKFLEVGGVVWDIHVPSKKSVTTKRLGLLEKHAEPSNTS